MTKKCSHRVKQHQAATVFSNSQDARAEFQDADQSWCGMTRSSHIKCLDHVDPQLRSPIHYEFGLIMIDFDQLAAFFRPECVAVVGASDKLGSVGHAVYSNLKAAQFVGNLIPINPSHRRIQGDMAWQQLSDLPTAPDLVVVCTPAATVPDIARSCGAIGVRGMIVISAGFREAGETGRALESELRSVSQTYPRMRLIGPNCLGVVAPHSRLNASFSATMPRPGNLAIISQSGALCTAMLDWAEDRQLGFSGCVSVGNMVDVGMGDLIDYFAADKQTSALLLYIESITDPRHFMAAARACTRTKPIIALKSGRFAESSQAASSHTGAIAGIDMVYEAALRRAGIERIFSFDELFNCARLLVGNNKPVGSHLAIVTNAGGPGVMATDAWLAHGGKLAQLSADTISSLNSQLPPQWSHGNPIDVLGDAPPERYAAAVATIARDPGVDSVIVMLTPQSMTNATAIADALSRFKVPVGKPLLAVWMGGPAVLRGRQILEKAGIPVYATPEQATSALTHLVSTGALRDQRTPSFLDSQHVYSDQKIPTNDMLQGGITQKISTKWRDRLAHAPGLLGEIASKELFADYSIPIVPTRLARTSDEAAEIAGQYGFPAVLKIVSADISHKTDVGGVELNLADADAVREAYQRIMLSLAEKQPLAHIDGVSVQPMIAPARGVELLLGSTRDAVFGPVIVIGSGGVTAEIQHDVAMELPPLTPQAALKMLQSLRIAPILQGYRGRPGVDLAMLAEVITKFSQLVEDRPELQAVEINPLLVTSDTILALDARVIVAPTITAPMRYAHLAVRPYPFDLIQDITLECGERLRLRPIHPNDESMWLAWVKEHPELYSQFLSFPQRACSLDYDTEMLFVAEAANHNWVGTALTPSRSETNRQQSIIGIIDETIRPDLRKRLFEVSEKWNGPKLSP